jgi:hypothetical protein
MKYRVTYSVLGLLLLVFAAALIVGYVVNTGRLRKAEQELQVARRELQALRQETGQLTIEDRTKFHAVTVPMDEPNTWRWRVFLPKGHRYAWRIATKDIPQNTVPSRDVGTAGITNAPYWETDNEVLVTATLRKTDEGDWRLAVLPVMGQGKHKFYGHAVTIPKEDLAWMFQVNADGQLLAHNGMVVRDPEGPFIFLQRRACERQPDGTDQPSPNPMPGFMIWLEKY